MLQGPTAPQQPAPQQAPAQATEPRAAGPEAHPEAANTNQPSAPAPGLYLVNPLMVGPLPGWAALLDHVASLGCTAVLLAPPTQPGPSGNLYHLGDPDQPHPCLEAPDLPAALRHLAEAARQRGLALYLDLVLDRAASAGAFAARHPAWFRAAAAEGPPDPRQPLPEVGTTPARLDEPDLQQDWLHRLQAWAASAACTPKQPRQPSGAT